MIWLSANRISLAVVLGMDYGGSKGRGREEG